MIKRLASLEQLLGPEFTSHMQHINRVGRAAGLREFTTYSRIWEYPWTWLQLEGIGRKKLRVLDVGSESSCFPWFLATQGFEVVVSDITANQWRVWRGVCKRLGVSVDMRILDARNLDLPTGSVDIYLSVSVIEHVPDRDKAKTIAEAARVLRPGGLLVMTFDICESEMGMTFPEWNGRALTMCEFDELFENFPWFEQGLSEHPWNTQDIAEYLSWHRTTAPHHNYVTGGAIVRRNDQIWKEPGWKDRWRMLRGHNRIVCLVGMWYLRCGFRTIQRWVTRLSGSLG
jgi:SAM-dependent methyltransferase